MGTLLLTAAFRYYSGDPAATPTPANAMAFVQAMNFSFFTGGIMGLVAMALFVNERQAAERRSNSRNTRIEISKQKTQLQAMLSLSALSKKYGLIALAFFTSRSAAVFTALSVFSSLRWSSASVGRGRRRRVQSRWRLFSKAPVCLSPGALTDRIGGRKTLMLGGLVLAVGLGFASTISSIWHFYFWMGIVIAHSASP